MGLSAIINCCPFAFLSSFSYLNKHTSVYVCVCVCVCEGPDDRCHFFPIPATKFSGFNGLAET